MSISIGYLQKYIKAKDYKPELKAQYFMRLVEEVGELAEAMRKDARSTNEKDIKETIDEEVWDIIYYALAIANCYKIDLEKVVPIKEELNNERHGNNIVFEIEKRLT